MLGPTRPVPHLGAKARISHFGGDVEIGVVCGLRDEGRLVEVSCEGGEKLEFTLSPATAKFVLVGSAHGAEMELEASALDPRPQGA
jgi:hypothetical protein